MLTVSRYSFGGLCRRRGLIKNFSKLFTKPPQSASPTAPLKGNVINLRLLQNLLGRCGHRPLRIVPLSNFVAGYRPLRNVRLFHLIVGCDAHIAPCNLPTLEIFFNPPLLYSLRRQGRHRLAAARSRSGSERPPDVHSLPSRRFATLQQGEA